MPHLIPSMLLLLATIAVVPAAHAASVDTTTLLFTADSFTSLALNDIALAYRLPQPNVTLSSVLDYATASQTLLELTGGATSATVDFGIISRGLTDAEVAVTPSVTMYPVLVTAVVPIYRLDRLQSSGVQLILSRQALAGIYSGQITWWNDSRIQWTNPSVILPAQRISVAYHNESLAMNDIFTRALAKFDSNFTQYFSTLGSQPGWPTASYYKPIGTAGANNVAAAVVANDGSIGYTALATALQMNNHVAAMINRAGLVVQPNSQSVTYSAVELGTQTLARTTLSLDLTDATGSSVWPICAMSYMVIAQMQGRHYTPYVTLFNY